MKEKTPTEPGWFRPRFLRIFNGTYSRRNLGSDLMAGATVGLIALPLSMALGIASIPPGTWTPFSPPAMGILTAIVAGFLISLLGGCRVQIGGPTAAFVPLILLIVQKHGYAGLALATVMAGVILIIMGLARMGNLIKFIPWPVTSGFTTGIAVSIMSTQVVDFLGIRSQEHVPMEFFEKLGWIAMHVPQSHALSIAFALGSIFVIWAWPKFGFRRLPGPIVAMLGSLLVVYCFGHGMDAATIGSKFGPNAIAEGFTALHWPKFDWAQIRDLIAPATAIALLGAIESLLSAVVADGLINGRHDSNTELIAQGVANIVCPFFGGLPATGAIARTAANIDNGGRSPVAGLSHSVTLLVIVLVFAQWASYVPLATMSAVLVMVALRMGEWHEFRRLHLMPPSDAVVLLTTFALTVIFDLVVAVEIGMVLAAILYIKRVSETTEVSRVTDEDVLETPEQLAQGKSIPDGVLVYRIFGPFLFGAAEKMEDALSSIERLPKVLILRLHLVTAMDATALNVLESVIERMREHHGTVILSGIHRQPLETLRRAGFIEVVGRENLCAHFDDALKRANELIAC